MRRSRLSLMTLTRRTPRARCRWKKACPGARVIGVVATSDATEWRTLPIAVALGPSGPAEANMEVGQGPGGDADAKDLARTVRV